MIGIMNGEKLIIVQDQSEAVRAPTILAKTKGRAYRKDCGSSRKYQAIRAPTCGCVACWTKYDKAQ
jgi:hypothetical protein